MTIEEFKALVAVTITDKTSDYSISPNDVGGRFDDLADIVDSGTSATVPLGTIIMYAPASLSEFDITGLGISSNVDGWAICNGNNSTPNLKGKFIVGYDSTDTDYDQIGETGGLKTVSLTESQNAEHKHLIAANQVLTSQPPLTSSNQVAYNYNQAGNNDYILYGTDTAATLGLTSGSGTGAPHENRPPYYTVLYIKKIA